MKSGQNKDDSREITEHAKRFKSIYKPKLNDAATVLSSSISFESAAWRSFYVAVIYQNSPFKTFWAVEEVIF